MRLVRRDPAKMASPLERSLDVGGPRQPMLLVRGLRKHYPVAGELPGQAAVIRAVDGVDFDLMKRETLGIVGESGCGKSTTARLLLHLAEPDAGEVVFDGQGVGAIRGVSIRQFRRDVQMVFQDSHASLNPLMSVVETIAWGPKVHGLPAGEAREVARRMLQRVGLPPEVFAGRYPHELSGGQRQRVNIARALALRPRVVIFDEAVSALDKSVEAQVLNLLCDLKEEFDLTYIFISHDLNVVRHVSDRVMVMYLGKVVEVGPAARLYERPLHPYTRALLSSRLSMDPRARRTQPPLTGDPPSPINPPSGCRFRTRCPMAKSECADEEPPLEGLEGVDDAHRVACHFASSASLELTA